MISPPLSGSSVVRGEGQKGDFPEGETREEEKR